MVSLDGMPENFYNIIFGDVTIEEFLPTIVVECVYKDNGIGVNGRLIVDKEKSKITLANIEINEYNTDPEYPVESSYHIARTEYPRINRVLDVFREANKLYGYNKKINIINMEDK
jgi:hypothetical protein|nr:MAG TPA: hypothetical protein [Caudoviricetes sp.]